jgi:hypothetical protein
MGRPLPRIVTTELLADAGVPRAVAARHVRAGRWQRPARGVYVTDARELTGLDLGRVARALTGGRVVVTGLVACRELGLRWVPGSSGVLVLVGAQVRTPSSGCVALRRTTDLATLPTWLRAGVDLAHPERAVVDAARELTRLRDVRGVVLGAVADRWVEPDGLRLLLDRTQRNGSGLCRRAIEDARRGCASPPEAELVDELIGCGRPFYANPALFLDGQAIGTPDAYFPGTGLGGEVESVERHGSEDGVETTYDRHERFAAAGVELAHLSVRRIRRDPAEAAGYLLSRVAARPPGAEPPGLVVLPRGPLLR